MKNLINIICAFVGPFFNKIIINSKCVSYKKCSAQGHDEYKVKGIVATGKFTCECKLTK